ncbi:MAG TPA: polyisoprenoid-binding protein [Rhodothermales bacterium]|nr:polyisoprenoid-binding protein [Rhodothermales bacterium]
MTFSFRALAMGALALGLSACASDTDTAEPLEGATEVAEAPAEIPAGTYAIDASHSELGFRVRHLGISNVDGTFNDFSGTVTIPETGLEGMTAMLTAQVASIDTDNERRNGHLRSPDFFAADEYPELTFQTTSITPTGGTSFEMTGDLTMRGTTRSVTLQGEYLGAAEIGGTQKIGFEASGEINRQDWGLSWAETNDAGEVIVADTVTLMIGVEADLQGDDAMAEEDAEADA